MHLYQQAPLPCSIPFPYEPLLHDPSFLLHCLLTGLFLCLQACNDASNPQFGTSKNQYLDPIAQRIYTFQDQQKSDSLLPYFSHTNPTYRALATKAFGSVQDSSVLPQLIQALADSVQGVVANAAFAIGQIRSEKGTEALMEVATSPTVGMNALFYVLEGLGKCATPTALHFFRELPNQ